MKQVSALLVLASITFGASTRAAESARDTRPDTWVATDALGRVVPNAPDVPSPRVDRFVAIFYFLWHDNADPRGPFDVTRILAANPDALKNLSSPPWGPLLAAHYWGEPLFGYYLGDDPWVIRKHAQMLVDAGVDVIVFDTSNKVTYPKIYTALFDTYEQIRREGGRTPQVAFLTPFGDPGSTVAALFDDIYSRHRYADLWFQWKGKPLILADPAQVDPKLRDFFMFRRPQPSYFEGPVAPDMWSWLEVYPQHVFRNSRGEKEQMSVGVAQNAVGSRLGSMSEPGSRGRSFHETKSTAATNPSPADVRYGLNVAEQWERAIKEDPQAIFVTGWNEWIAGRFAEFAGIRTPPMFVDEYDQEHSRDIEPVRGGHGDDYYYQLVSYVRRFKGARPLEHASAAKTIAMDGDFTAWADVKPEFLDDLYDTAHRQHPGSGHAGPYHDESGRNDFDTMKVARDENQIYLYVRTRDAITEPAGEGWMNLLIDADRNHASGWEGYDFLINRSRADGDSCTVERGTHGWKWEPVGKARLIRRGKEMVIAIPRAILGLDHTKGPLSFDFKWADNNTGSGDILDFISKGDVAPNGRFNYRFQE